MTNSFSFCLFENIFIFSSCVKVILLNTELQVGVFFSPHFKYFCPYSTCFAWIVERNSIWFLFCSSIGKSFSPSRLLSRFSLSLVFHSLSIIMARCSLFVGIYSLSILWVFWICGLASDINFGKFLALIIHTFLLLLSPLSDIFVACYTIYSCPIVLDTPFCFAYNFSLCISFLEFILTVLEAHWFFPWPCPLYWWAHWRHSSLLFLVLLIYSIYFWFFLITLICLFTSSMCSSMLFILSIRVLSIFIIIIFKSSWQFQSLCHILI